MARSGPAPRRGRLILEWALWTLAFALALGGKPWTFPAHGRYWREKARAQTVEVPSSLSVPTAGKLLAH